MTRYCWFETAIGRCGIAWRGEAVVGFRLPQRADPDQPNWFESRLGASLGAPDDVVYGAIAAVQALLATGRGDLTLIACDYGPVDAAAKRIYDLTRAIPPGSMRTYGDIATEVGDRQLAQRVGVAMATNPIPIIVACHRVVGAHGKLTGFTAEGGVELKRRLLMQEGAIPKDLLFGANL
jgi:methylated-DNA-[protein]-cysteine S-methyltransferase